MLVSEVFSVDDMSWFGFRCVFLCLVGRDVAQAVSTTLSWKGLDLPG